MLIAADIGNTSITIGYFRDSGLTVQRIPTHPLRDANYYRQMLLTYMEEKTMAKSAHGGIISSVVPGHTGVLREVLAALSGKDRADIMVVSSAMASIGFRIPEPELLGPDRIANAEAASALINRPVAVIDFGSATTITVVDRQGFYIGGSIMPGVGLMNEALQTKTAKLGKVELARPGSALGRDTTGCILAGLLIGTAGAVERIIEQMEAETGLIFSRLLTGGYCSLIEPFIRRPHIVRPDLTLEGLKILYEKNRAQ